MAATEATVVSGAPGGAEGGDAAPAAPCAPSVSATEAAPAAAAVPAEGGVPKCYMLVGNLQSRKNLGNIMRSCVAFGVTEIVAVGSLSGRHFGSHGTERYAALRHYDKMREAVAYVRGKGARVCGIEIVPGAVPVQSHPFTGDTAFLAGNEGAGLCDAHKALCDYFVYIPQHGMGTASLNVTVATSIVLHHFALWARFPELDRQAGIDKFALEPPVRDHSTRTPEQLARAAARAATRAAAAAAAGMTSAVLPGVEEGGGGGGGGGGAGDDDSEDDDDSDSSGSGEDADAEYSSAGPMAVRNTSGGGGGGPSATRKP